MTAEMRKIFFNTVLWGFLLWLFGYVLGILFFAFVPAALLGWSIMPFGVAATLWVLFKKIERKQFSCYIGLGVIWALMAIALDYVFLVLLFKPEHYYKPDVYLYYTLTLVLPIAVGWYTFRRGWK